MILKGKIALLPHKIKGLHTIKTIFEKCKKFT